MAIREKFVSYETLMIFLVFSINKKYGTVKICLKNYGSITLLPEFLLEEGLLIRIRLNSRYSYELLDPNPGVMIAL
jgi:hypothetical protein